MLEEGATSEWRRRSFCAEKIYELTALNVDVA
jgi:hypothetical protein